MFPPSPESDNEARQAKIQRATRSHFHKGNQPQCEGKDSPKVRRLSCRLADSPPPPEEAYHAGCWDWPNILGQVVTPKRQSLGLGEQLRPLLVHGGFAGLGSHSRMLKEVGIAATELVTAEPKEHAVKFMFQNDLLGEHVIDNVRDMIPGAECECRRCMRRCRLSTARPDVFFGGFPCQAFSTMRTDAPRPEEHDTWVSCESLVTYLLATQPRAAVLENTPGFNKRKMCDKEPQTGLCWLASQVQDLFYMNVVDLDLLDWIDVRRRRIWIFLTHKDTGTQDTVDRARHIALEIQGRCTQHCKAHIEDLMLQPGTRSWETQVNVGLSTRAALRTRRLPPMDDDMVAKWQEQTSRMREQWRDKGIDAWDSHPLLRAALRGLSATPRERETLEVFLINACMQSGGSPSNPEAIERTKKQLVVDISQNPAWIKAHAQVSIPTICKNSRIYAYGHDRIIMPMELLFAHGWRTPKGEPDCGELTFRQIQDLAGECQALPCLAVAWWALALSLGDALPGLWGSREGQGSASSAESAGVEG